MPEKGGIATLSLSFKMALWIVQLATCFMGRRGERSFSQRVGNLTVRSYTKIPI